jgi:hypothetical protein
MNEMCVWEYWWNDTVRGRSKCSKLNLSQYQFVHYIWTDLGSNLDSRDEKSIAVTIYV